MKTPISVVLFFNCALLLSCIWQLFRLYRNKGKRNKSFYVYGITALIACPWEWRASFIKNAMPIAP